MRGWDRSKKLEDNAPSFENENNTSSFENEN